MTDNINYRVWHGYQFEETYNRAVSSMPSEFKGGVITLYKIDNIYRNKDNSVIVYLLSNRKISIFIKNLEGISTSYYAQLLDIILRIEAFWHNASVDL